LKCTLLKYDTHDSLTVRGAGGIISSFVRFLSNFTARN